MVQRVTMNDGQVLELDDDEIATLIREAQSDDDRHDQQHRQKHPRPRIVVAKANSSSSPLYRQSWCWAMTLLVAAVLVLLTTDSLQVHVSIRGIDLQHSTRKGTNPRDDDENEHPIKGSSYQSEPESTPKTIRNKSPVAFPIRYRGPKLDKDQKDDLTAQFGQWSLTDDDLAKRPVLDCSQFSHCDIPRSSFPPRAWQTDRDFVERFLTQGLALVTRAQEAILAEYGHSSHDQPSLSFEERSAMFQLTMLDLKSGADAIPGKRANVDNGGWTTTPSFQGLVRRALHAIVTQDTFTFAMGGHSSATGHGNYFKQSYTMQFHKVMEPVFARLGVTLHSHNMAQGGLGTIQNAMAMGSLYGNEIDLCMWDSGMTESISAHYDVFARQALMSGNRVPALWGGFADVLQELHNKADVDIGAVGSAMKGIAVTMDDAQQALTIPYAARYLNCDHEAKTLCEENKYNAICWLDRSDVRPPKWQDAVVGGRAGWHPGFRTHQLQGRVLAFTVLMALQEALQSWKNAADYALPDSAWHVTTYYQNIRDKLAALKTTPCFTDKSANLPTVRICDTVLKGVSEFTPRFRPSQTSIRSIMKNPSAIAGPPPNIYNGPDIYNPALEPPENAINYLAIVENDATTGSRFRSRLLVGSSLSMSSNRNATILQLSTPPLDLVAPDQSNADYTKMLSLPHDADNSRALDQTTLEQGRGWAVHTKAGDIHCDGTWDSECGRGADESCLLSGHNDGRGGLFFDSFSGWLVLNLKGVKDGIIIIKFESWHNSGADSATEGWTSENNGAEQGSRRLDHTGVGDVALARHRELGKVPDFCEEFVFEYAIDGDIHSLNQKEFMAKRVMVQRVVETLTLLDDPHFAAKEIDVELGIRIRGCQRVKTFSLTHVYWA